MGTSNYQIIMINGRIIEFAADEVQDYGTVFSDSFVMERSSGNLKKIMWQGILR